MKFSFGILVTATMFLNSTGISTRTWAADLPKSLNSAPCSVPPTIDGKINAAEWKPAPVIEFELPVLHFKTQKIVKRTCQWRAMNSANALYVALQVPDPTVNKSLNPMDLDLASLGFCRGTDVAANDDRKVVAPGFYLDKHVTTPGKDADDKQVDGKGALFYDAGVYTMEWAIPLNSGDAQDLQAKAGDKVLFNLAYIDAFQFDLKETEIGSAYVGGLDKAKDWGTLTLAADVQDDGGAAFRGPAWVKQALESIPTIPANRLRVVESSLMPSLKGSVAKVLVEYDYRNPQGKTMVGKAKMYLPAQDDQFVPNLPLYYSAGYELDDGGAMGQVLQGFAVVTPRGLEANPLVRTANPDIALLHIVRSFPFLDDSRVIIAGGSAGGYITLLLAGETFPLAGAAPSVPPVNWGYNAAYFLQRENGKSRKDEQAPKTPVFDVIVPIVQSGTKLYGTNTNDETYYRHSPLAHFDTITCPVSVNWTTADMLVPIDQVGMDWVRPFAVEKFPPGFSFDPETLTNSKQGRVRVVDVLKPADYEVFVIPEEQIKQELVKLAKTRMPADLPISENKQWSIAILDEGPPEPQVGHLKYPVPWSQQKFIAKCISGKIAVNQLTARKLERMMDRYAGREWLLTGLDHLDFYKCERADVLRGLKTYVAAGPEHAKLLAELYAKLPIEKQVLSAETVREWSAR